MKFDWNYYVGRLLSRSDNKNLKENTSNIISDFGLLEGQMVEGLRDPSTLEYGLWLSNRSVNSSLEYSTFSESLSRGTIVEESLGMQMLNNVFEIKDNWIEFFKVVEDSLIKVTIQKINEKECIVTQEMYLNINELLGVIFSRYSEIGNSNLFILDVKTIDTIIKVIRLLPDKKIVKNIVQKDDEENKNSIYSKIAEDLYYSMESLNSKVKRK